MHSARWDHDLDLDGRRVAVIGTGASSIQLVPGSVDRDHVDLETSPIGRVVEDGLITADGRLVEADVLVLGTGFRSTEFLAPMQVTGRRGATLDDAWREGAEAHLGMAVPGFPNLFLLYGPNTNLGHNSIIFMIEPSGSTCGAPWTIWCTRPAWTSRCAPRSPAGTTPACRTRSAGRSGTPGATVGTSTPAVG